MQGLPDFRLLQRHSKCLRRHIGVAHDVLVPVQQRLVGEPADLDEIRAQVGNRTLQIRREEQIPAFANGLFPIRHGPVYFYCGLSPGSKTGAA